MINPTRKIDYLYDLTNDYYSFHPTKPHDVFYWIVEQYIWEHVEHKGGFTESIHKTIQTSPDFLTLPEALVWIEDCEKKNKKETN